MGNPESFGLIIYPNPAASILNVKATAEIQHIRIFSFTGELIREYALNGKSMVDLDIRSLLQGVYILQVEGSFGRYHKQWVKQ